VTGSTATSISVSFDASVAGVACVVRVTDGDDQTSGDFSALVITNPAQNLYAASAGRSCSRRAARPVVLGGNATTQARYLHVIGGGRRRQRARLGGDLRAGPLGIPGASSPSVSACSSGAPTRRE